MGKNKKVTKNKALAATLLVSAVVYWQLIPRFLATYELVVSQIEEKLAVAIVASTAGIALFTGILLYSIAAYFAFDDDHFEKIRRKSKVAKNA